MRWLKENTAKIRAYVKEDTEDSLTHAALECRLSIELVCYERLRIAHDYISHKDIRRWQPKHVIEVLVALGNDAAAQSFTLSILPHPVEGERELEVADLTGTDWIEVGRQVGFDPAHIGKLWQGLSHFLHVQVPKSKSDELRAYGDKEALRRKVLEALSELDRLSEGTMISSGTGEEVSFDCVCGITNKRKAKLLQPGSRLSCIDPTCKEQYRVHKSEGGSFDFERIAIEVKCRTCEAVAYFPEAQVVDIGLNRTVTYDCPICGEKNAIRWALQQAV